MIVVEDAVYARYQAPDLAAMERFLTHFGLCCAERTEQRLCMRGAGRDPVVHVTDLGAAKTVGFALRAQSKAVLDVLATETGQAVVRRDEPGGGYAVRLTDPAGYSVDIVWGIAPVAPYRPVGSFLSLPTHTTARWSPV